MKTLNNGGQILVKNLSVVLLLLSYALMVNGIGHTFALLFLLILASKELGYFLALRHYGFTYYPPYILPFPYPFGSLGSFTSIQSVHDNPEMNIDVYTRGIFYAFITSVIMLVIGLKQSTLGVPGDFGYRFAWGHNLISTFFHYALNLESSQNALVDYHPLYLAGLAGTFTCALSLLPIGQLSGGYIMRRLLGARYIWVSMLMGVILFVLGFVQHYSWLLILSVYLLFAYHHYTDKTVEKQLTQIEKAKLIFCIFIFILSFMPIPYTFSM